MSQEKIDYFMLRTEKDIDELKDSHSRLHEKVDRLLEFKWQIIGGALAGGTIISAIVSFVFSILKL